MQSHEAGAARVDRLATEHAHLCGELAGPDVRQVGAATGHLVPQRAKYLQFGVEPCGRPPLSGNGDCVTALEVVVVHADQIERDPIARRDLRFGAAVGLNAPNPRGVPSHIYLLVGVQRAACQCAGDDGATALRGEDPIDPQARTAVVRGYGSRVDEFVESIAEIVETSPVVALTATILASARKVSASRSRTSISCNDSHSSSTRSAFVRATIP